MTASFSKVLAYLEVALSQAMNLELKVNGANLISRLQIRKLSNFYAWGQQNQKIKLVFSFKLPITKTKARDESFRNFAVLKLLALFMMRRLAILKIHETVFFFHSFLINMQSFIINAFK